MKKVLVVGSGGREHAIAMALVRSPKVGKIYCAPGNAGTSQIATNVPIRDTDIKELRKFALENSIDLTVVGPESALSEGLADYFHKKHLAVFAHSRKASRIETSKEFAKKLMKKYNIPTASYRAFTDYDKALSYVKSMSLPTVIKYDGLAAGKGVVVAEDLAQADQALKDMLLDKSFGKGKVVIEEFLSGPEFSFMCFVCGEKIIPMPLAQDHKRAFDGDKGPNTGGMGAYTSLPFISARDRKEAFENIMRPTAKAMVQEGCPLSGVLYGGLMKTKDGVKVIEFNARFGDPETEVVLPLMESDLYDTLEAVALDKRLCQAKWSKDVTLGVVLASKGYPGKYTKGITIKGLDNVKGMAVHMGTATDAAGNFITAGGRVLMCVAKAPTLLQAKKAAYSDASMIECDNLFYRNDIAHQAL